jgi:hypothetical protein
MATRARREQVLRAHGARDQTLEELLGYTENRFQEMQQEPPLADQESVTAWRRYAATAAAEGVLESLRRPFIQLRFPVEEGMSEEPAYQAATRYGRLGEDVLADQGLQLQRPDRLELILQPTPAGTIPILVAGERADFVALLQCLLHRNEPRQVPDAVGAMMIAGYNNWDRVRELRRSWEAQDPGRVGDDDAWNEELRRLIPHRELYQDSFILLTNGPYSGVEASALGLSDSDWLETSLSIRREHECTHYFTRRVFGSMANSVHDELIADLMGIVAATGRFKADWFLRFMGMESNQEVRSDGRVHSYRGKPPLGDDAFSVLRSMLRAAAVNLETAVPALPETPWSLQDKTAVLCGLSRLALEELAADDGVELIRSSCRA